MYEQLLLHIWINQHISEISRTVTYVVLKELCMSYWQLVCVCVFSVRCSFNVLLRPM